MKVLQTILPQLDQFGTKFEFPVQGSSRVYKTLVGGAGSVAIYTLGLIYFVYLFYIFAANEIPPSIYQVLQYYKEDIDYKFQKPILAFQYIGSPISYSDPNRVFFIPVIKNFNGFELLNQSTFTKGGRCSNQFSGSNLTDYFCVDQPYIIGKRPNSPGMWPYIEILLEECEQSKLLPGQYCANEDELNQFWSTGFLHSIFMMQEFDYSKQELRTVSKDVYVYPFKYSSYVFGVQLSNVQVDSNILFQDFKSQVIISDVDFTLQQLNEQILSTRSQGQGSKVLTQISINLQSQIVNTSIQYKKFAGVMAEFQSMFNVLLIIGMGLKFYSETKLEEMVCQSIIRKFYPEIKDKELKTVVSGFVDKTHFLNKDHILEKINVQSVFQELIELRFLINLMLTKQQFQQAKNLGLHLSSQEEHHNKPDNHILAHMQKVHPAEPQDLKSISEIERNIDISAHNMYQNIQEQQIDQNLEEGKKLIWQKAVDQNHLNDLYNNKESETTQYKPPDKNQTLFSVRFAKSIVPRNQ